MSIGEKKKKKHVVHFFSAYWQILDVNSCRYQMLDKGNTEIWARSWNEEAYIMENAVPSVFGYARNHSKLRGQIHSSCHFTPFALFHFSLCMNSFYFLVLQCQNHTYLFCNTLFFLAHWQGLLLPVIPTGSLFLHNIFHVNPFSFLPSLIHPRKI